MQRISTRTTRALGSTPSCPSTPIVRAFATAVSSSSSSSSASSSSSSSSSASSSSSSSPFSSTHLQPPPTHARTRPLPARKQLLYASHANLLASNEVVLFLRQADFTAQEYNTLRTQLAALTTKSGNETDLKYTLTVLRPGLLSALLRDPTLVKSIEAGLLGQDSHTKGALSVLTAKTFDPPTLKNVLKLVNTYSALPSANQPPPADASKGEEVQERLRILSALAERKAIEHERVKDLGELPSLDTLRAQLVGLLSSPAARIIGVLGARADEVKRTLQGFHLGLQEQQEGGKKE